MQKDIKNFTQGELKEVFKKEGIPLYCTKQIFSWVYKKRIEDFDLMTDISKENRRILKENFYFSKLELLKREISQDGAEKFLFGLDDNSKIETVLIPEKGRRTICVSTQVGCKFSCKFCMSGKNGFKRDLTVSEIVNQYLAVQDLDSANKITNLVFMGTGEPLDNFSNTVKAIKIFMDEQGAYFGKRHICISTVGLAPQIEELAKLKLGIKLSISLHSSNNAVRSKIMPVNKKYPLEELIKAVKNFSKFQKYSITFEYVLIKGVNANRENAVELTKLLKGLNCKVNLISYNVSPLGFEPPEQGEIDIFGEELKKRGIFFTSRKSRGEDINAACGQLYSRWA